MNPSLCEESDPRNPRKSHRQSPLFYGTAERTIRTRHSLPVSGEDRLQIKFNPDLAFGAEWMVIKDGNRQ